MADRRDWKLRENLRVDSTVRRVFAVIIVALAAVALLMLLFGDRVDNPRVDDDNRPVSPPNGKSQGPAPTTPAPPAIPKNQQ